MSSLQDQAILCLKKYAELHIKSSEEDDPANSQDNRLVDQLKNYVAYYCKSEAKTALLDKYHAECMQKIAEAQTSDQCKQIYAKFEKKIEILDKIDGKKFERYKEFVNLLDGEEDSILVVQASDNFIDPISKKRMIDPVKNSACGHSYEHSVVLQLIKNNPRTRCPMMGCSAYIEKKSLVPDEQLKQKLARACNDSASEDEDSQLISLDVTV